jgi:hypothetical protein
MTGVGAWRSTPYEGTAVPFAPPFGSSVAAFIPRTKATERVAVSALTAWFGRQSPVLADPQRPPAGCRAIPAQEIGGHLEENAPAVGQPRAAQAITESGRPKSSTSALGARPPFAQGK